MNKKTQQKQDRKQRARELMETRSQAGNLINTEPAPVTEWFKEHLSRRSFGKGLAWSAALGMAGLTIYQLASDDDPEVSLDSLELQRKSGWNIGSTKPLEFAGSVTKDSREQGWTSYAPETLLKAYQPQDTNWQPFFVPTLIQSLSQDSLKQQMRPIRTAQMQDAYERARGLRELLSQTQNGNQTLIVADLPGSEAIALGAQLADTTTLVPQFDNWPHPLGVVKSHETLGAMVYYANEVQEKRAQLKPNAPALLLLDSNRLANYQDADTQFDNRFLAKLPPPDQLKQRGVQNVIYLVKDDKQKVELDDLNDDFVALEKQNIGVKMLRLSDFQPYDEEITRKQADGTTTRATERYYYYYGRPWFHYWFYDHYFYRPYSTVYVSRGGYNVPLSRPTSAPNVAPPSYRPVSRPTLFSAARVGGTNAGVGRIRPSGFGRTSVRMGAGGQVTGVRTGRSGSYGRGFGGWFGG